MSKPPVSIKNKNRIKGFVICLALLSIQIGLPGVSRSEASDLTIRQKALSYPEILYKSGEYYRSMSEIMRLKFELGYEKDELQLDILYLKNAYKLKEYRKILDSAPGLMENPGVKNSPEKRHQVGKILTATLVNLKDYSKAADTWDACCSSSGREFVKPDEIPGMVDPDRARWYSTFLPGSGLLLSGEYGKALVSFLLNSITLYGIYHYGTHQQMGTAGLLLFFEIGWYAGGRNASAEAAEDHNRALVSEYYQSNYYPELGN